MQKIKYITNKELLLEIDRSKQSYCYFVDPEKYGKYDVIVDNIDCITKEFVDHVLLLKNTKAKRGAALPEIPAVATDLVFRVMTQDHVPLSDDKKKRSRSVAGQGRLRTNFPPFKHFVLRDDELIEVGRSHWVNGLQNGEFSLDQGEISDRLAMMFMLLVERYSRRGNFRGYSYVDECRASALLQLSQVGLQFNEILGSNPFAFFTTTVRNAFVRVLNIERKNQDIRDDLLIMGGAMPSYTRQIENELNQKDQDSAPASASPPSRRGRPKPVVPVEIE